MSLNMVPTEWLERTIVIDELRRSYVALSAVLGRLRQHQPTFEDEDVARPQIQLHRSPSRHLLDEEGDGATGNVDLAALHSDPLSPVGSPEPANDALRAVTSLADAVDPLNFGSKPAVVTLVEFLRSTCRFLSGYDPKRRAQSTRGHSAPSSQSEARQETLAEARHRGAAWFVFAQIVESLVVYFNTQPTLLTELMGKPDNLLLLLKVLERGSFLSTPEPHEGAAFPMRRSTCEMEELEATLLEGGVPEELVGKVVNAYGQELLVDGALPPAVCSGRHEAASEAATRQRGLLCTQILAPRFSRFIASLVQNGDYDRVAFLVNLSLTAAFKVRLKLCDRLIAEGLFQKIAEDVFPRRSTHRPLISDHHQLARVLDILSAFSRPSDDDDAAAANSSSPGSTPTGSSNASPKRRRKPPAWSSDPHLPRIFQGCFDVLAEVPAHVHGGVLGVHLAKITAFLIECVQTELRPVVVKLAELVDAALDHMYSRCIHRLLPIILAILKSPLLRKPQEEELPGMVGCWFGTLLIHANFSNAKHRATDRQYLLRVEPYFRFASALVDTPQLWAAGAHTFLEKTRVAATLITDHATTERLHVNLLFSVVQRARLSLTRAELATSSRFHSHSHSGLVSPTSANAALERTCSARKRSRSPSTADLACGEVVFPPDNAEMPPPSALPEEAAEEAPDQRHHHRHHRHNHHHHHHRDKASDATSSEAEDSSRSDLPGSPIQRSVSPQSGHSPADPTFATDGSPIVSTTTAAKGVGEFTWKALRLFTQPLVFAATHRSA